MSKFRTALMLLVGVVVILSLIMPACAPKTEQTKTSAKPTVLRTITITDLSGPYAPLVGALRLGLIDVQNYINDAGGIDGVPVLFDIGDMEGKPEMIMPVYNRMLAQSPKPICLLGMDTQAGTTLHDRIIEDGLLGFGTAPDSLYPYGNGFGIVSAFSTNFGLFLDSAMARWQAAGKTGKPKLATFSWDMPFGHSFMNAASRAYLEKKGFELVGEYYYPTKTLNITTQLVDARAKGADITYNGSGALSPITQAKGMKELGWKPFIAGSHELDNIICQLAESAVDGWIGPKFIPTWNEVDTNPAVKMANDYFLKTPGRTGMSDRGCYYFLSWIGGMFFKRIIGDTVQRVGWEKLSDVQELKKTILSYREPFPIEIGGGILGYWGGFSETEYLPSMGRMYEVRKDPKEFLGPYGVFPMGEWVRMNQLVTDKMKQTGRD